MKVGKYVSSYLGIDDLAKSLQHKDQKSTVSKKSNLLESVVDYLGIDDLKKISL